MATMFAIGDDVLSQKTGHIGKVVGYGHEMVNGVYLPTIKVLIAESLKSGKKAFVEEDLHSTWVQPQAASTLSSK
jgi:hypothetical protein